MFVLTSKFILSDDGRSYLHVYMKPFEDATLSRVQFKVDSGADLTTVSKRELVLLGYSYEWIENNIVEDSIRTLSRAGGKAQPACYVRIDVLNILGREFVNWPLYIRKERHLDFPNLLGINMLTYFNFRFDYEDWAFIIETISEPNRILPMLPGQSICEITDK